MKKYTIIIMVVSVMSVVVFWTIYYCSPPQAEKKSVIESVCDDWNSWSKEELSVFYKKVVIAGDTIETGPWDFVRGAERNLDTIVNGVSITFVTDDN